MEAADPVNVTLVALFVLYLLALVWCAVLTGLKGKYGFVILGLLIHLVWFIGAIRLAKPRSYWARRVYNDEKMRRAIIHFSN